MEEISELDLSYLIEDLTRSLDILSDLYNDISPRIICRKVRFRNKFIKRYYIIYNPINDLLPSPYIFNFIARRLFKKNKELIKWYCFYLV